MLLCWRRPRKCHNHGVVGYVSTLKQHHMLWASQNRAVVLVQIPAWTQMPVSRAFHLLRRAGCEILTFLPFSVWRNQSIEGREAQCCLSICGSNAYWFDSFFFFFYSIQIQEKQFLLASPIIYALSKLAFETLARKYFFPPCNCACLGISKMKLAFLGLGL